MGTHQSFGLLRFKVKNSRTFLMNSIVSQYLFLLTSFESATIKAKSFVIKPRSTVSITLCSNKVANI